MRPPAAETGSGFCKSGKSLVKTGIFTVPGRRFVFLLNDSFINFTDFKQYKISGMPNQELFTASRIIKNRMVTPLLTGMLWLSLLNPLLAQRETVDTAAFRQIRDAEMNSSQVANIAHYITDVSGSRLTNSPGFMRAGNWAIETMKHWGLQNAGFEAWGEYGRGWDMEEFHISMKAPYSGYILGYAQPWSSNTNGEIHANVFLINYANLLDSAFLEKHVADFSGKIILVNSLTSKRDDDFKPFSTRFTDSELVKIQDMDMISRGQIEAYLKYKQLVERGKLFLKSAGALAMVSINGGGRDGTVTVQNMSGYKTNSPVRLPEAIISSEDSSKIKRLIASGHNVELSLNIQGKFYSDDTKGYNVVAEIPGTDPKLKDQVVMLGGHLDSWNAATGATDNGAGCSDAGSRAPVGFPSFKTQTYDSNSPVERRRAGNNGFLQLCQKPLWRCRNR